MGLFEFVDEDISIGKPKKTGPKGLFDIEEEDSIVQSTKWSSLQEGTIPERKVIFSHP